MGTENKFTVDDISNFLKNLVEIGGVYVVSPAPEYYIQCKIKNSDETKPVTITSKNEEGKTVENRLALFSTSDTSCIGINPYAMGDFNTNNNWLMVSCSINLSANIIKTMRELIRIAAENNVDRPTDDEDDKTITAIKFLGSLASQIDEKMIKEFDEVSTQVANFFTIDYNRAKGVGMVNCQLCNPSFPKTFGKNKIRRTSWDVFTELFYNVIGGKDLTNFNFRSTSTTYPSFDSRVNILVQVYDKIKTALSLIDLSVVNLEEIKNHLPHISEYGSIAKWYNDARQTTTIKKPTETNSTSENLSNEKSAPEAARLALFGNEAQTTSTPKETPVNNFRNPFFDQDTSSISNNRNNDIPAPRNNPRNQGCPYLNDRRNSYNSQGSSFHNPYFEEPDRSYEYRSGYDNIGRNRIAPSNPYL